MDDFLALDKRDREFKDAFLLSFVVIVGLNWGSLSLQLSAQAKDDAAVPMDSHRMHVQFH